MKTLRALLFFCASLAIFCFTAKATPYASGVTNTGTNITFTLNEPADAVWVIFNDGAGASNNVDQPPIQAFTEAVTNSGGTGYLVNDVVTVVGGSGVPATIQVLGVSSSGAITNSALLNLGDYTGGDLALPANPAAVTGGSGTNATFALTYGYTNGTASFTYAAGETNYLIYVKKLGDGLPSQISYDGSFFSQWGTPRGVDVNANPKVGNLFGRIYLSEAGAASGGKTQGLYALNADRTDSPLQRGATAFPTSFWVAGNSSSPYRLEVAPDNSLYVSDFSATTNAGLWRFGPDFGSTNFVLAPGNVGRLSGRAVVTGSPETGDFTIFTGDATLSTIATNSYGWSADDEGPGHAGEYNNVFRYKLGANTIPPGGWANPADLAINVGLNGIPTLTVEPAIEPNTGNIYCMFYRLNFADPCLIVTDPTGVNRLFTSLDDSLKNVGPDPFVGANSVDITKDGRYLLIENVFDELLITSITNGIPDLSSTFTIADAPEIANERGTCFDAAYNVYSESSGQGLFRVFSLGFPSTAVTGNDLTGTNGTFHLLLPPTAATVAATTPQASQNHGSPTAGAFTITLNTNFLAAPVTIAYTLGGTGTNGVNYTASSSGSVTFPAGTSPSGNWSQQVTITPTLNPVSGPTFTVTLTLQGGPTYQAVSPKTATVFIQNTGPQLLSITSVPGPTMYRGLTNDAANFVITRYGDTNAGSYDVSTFTYGGTAVFGSDYTAGAQAPVTTPNGSPIAGNPTFTIHPGDIQVAAVVGNPIPSPINAAPVNKTISVGITAGTGYTATTNTAEITEIDNARGNEVLLWSDPLTSAADSVNWTVTFASTNLGDTTVPPVVLKNYDNAHGYNFGTDNGGTNDFDVEFGYVVATDQVGPSLVMQSNGWTTALKTSVNKDSSITAAAGVNVYPQGMNFAGNFALRFTMMLVEGDYVGAGAPAAENAIFGIDHKGTNCNWIGADAKTGSLTTNQDGVWMDIGAAEAQSGGVPADFAMYEATTFPNAGWFETTSAVEQSFADVFRHPSPFTGNAAGTTNVGSPANLSDFPPFGSWVDVEVKQYQGTNYFSIDKTLVLSFSNTLVFTNGTIMLGYDDPYANVGQTAAAAYYSDVRVVEIAPYISNQPVSLVVNEGQPAGFSVGAIGTAPFTNVWYFGATPVLTNIVLDPSDATSYNIASATALNDGSYSVVVSDAAGSITSSIATLAVIVPPAVTNSSLSITTNWHVTVTLPAGISGTSPTYEWVFGGSTLTNGGRISGATSAALTISDLQLSDSGTYTVVATNAAGGITNTVMLTVIMPPSPDITSFTLNGTNASFVFSSSDIYDTTGSFTLESSTNVAGPYTPVSTTITNSGTNFFITIPQSGPTKFYEILHQ